jgi:predicted HTH transcriptional regulator
MDWTSLHKLIQEGENSRLEFKESEFLNASADEIAAEITSFANRYG